MYHLMNDFIPQEVKLPVQKRHEGGENKKKTSKYEEWKLNNLARANICILEDKYNQHGAGWKHIQNLIFNKLANTYISNKYKD